MALSTMMKQYLSIKEGYKDTILLFRLGDFYEMFFEDAIIASEVLGLTLTGRDCGLEKRAPMCGVPFHSVNNYLSKLIESGYKAAICEQTSKPEDQKGIIKREVVRVVTKGTIIESDFLAEGSNNYLMSVYFDETTRRIGVAWSDISTGEIGYQSFEEKANIKLNELLTVLSPAEIICNETMLAESLELSVVKYNAVCPFSLYKETAFDYDNAKSICNSFFSIDYLKKVTCDRAVVCSIGGLLEYIKETQKKKLAHLSTPLSDNMDEYMSIDMSTRKNLEILETVDCKKKGSLLWVINRTVTPMGARKLKKWLTLPCQDEVEINDRLNAVEELFENKYICDEITLVLKNIRDLERLNARVASNDISPKELLELALSLRNMPKLKELLKKTSAPRFVAIDTSISTFDDFVNNVISAIISQNPPNHLRDGGFINKGFDEQLDTLLAIRENAKSILSKLEQDEREETQIKNLKIGYNRIFGYYIEVAKSQLANVPYRYVRKQTVANGERYITDELKELEHKILNSEQLMLAREMEIYQKLLSLATEHVQSVLETAKAISYLDCLVSHAVASREHSYTKPRIGKDIRQIKLIESRHPVVELLLKKENFVPNDVLLDEDTNRINLITGPNMAGKSVYMRQVALITLMAHIGCFVPSKSAEISIVDKIFTRIGASDDIGTGRSTFMVEMSEVANILQNATNNSLMLFDEVGRGTATYDGLSIAWSLIEYLSKNYNSKIMFSTHYHELTELEGKLQGIKNYKLSIREMQGNIVFLRKVMRGSANKSFGIEVAALSGLPTDVIVRAKDILKKLEAADINNKNITIGNQLSMFDNTLQKEIVAVLRDVDTDSISPRLALDIIIDLKEKAQKY